MNYKVQHWWCFLYFNCYSWSVQTNLFMRNIGPLLLIFEFSEFLCLMSVLFMVLWCHVPGDLMSQCQRIKDVKNWSSYGKL